MLRKGLMAAAVAFYLVMTDAAMAQDGGIWAARPIPGAMPRRSQSRRAPFRGWSRD